MASSCERPVSAEGTADAAACRGTNGHTAAFGGGVYGWGALAGCVRVNAPRAKQQTAEAMCGQLMAANSGL